MQRSRPAHTDAARILIVDHDGAEAGSLADALSQALPAEPVVVEAPNGRAAAELLRAGNFDMLLLDLGSLGDLGGTAEDGVAKLVKLASGALAVALSDGGSVSASLAAMRAGAHDVIQRPAGGPAFAVRLGELAQRHGRPWMTSTGASGRIEMAAAMLSSAGAALRSAAEPAKRPQVLPMWQQEQRIIEDAIASFSGNITLAAAALELNPSTIYRKRQAWAEMEDGTKGAA